MDIELAKSQEVLFEPDGSNFREQVEYLENLMLSSDSPDILKGNSELIAFKHLFSEGIYTREIFLEKGMFIIGKIHKLDHTFFLMKGKLLLCTEEGVSEVEGPYYSTAKAGAKRVALALEDSIFVNVHPNPNNIKDLEKLEEMFVVSSYEDYENYKLLNT